MPRKFQKIEAGFSIMEIIIVLAIITIMTGLVVSSSVFSNKKAGDTEAIARQLAAELRALQNEALNGKIIGGTVACRYNITVYATYYEVRYQNCTDSAVIAAGSKDINISAKQVTLTAVPSSITFLSPMGNNTSSQKITVTSVADASIAMCVSITSIGSVSESAGACT